MSDTFAWLQFFAEGAAGADGASGDGADTGAETADAGRSLEELGVPREKAERYRARREKAAPAVLPAGEAEDGGTGGASEQKGSGVSWDDFMALPENRQRLQRMMAERGRSAAAARAEAEARMERLNPMFRLLAGRYGIEARDGVYDADAIVRAVTGDDSYYQDKADEMGVSADVARRLDQADELRQERAREQARREREEELQRHFMQMRQQADELRTLYPDFDLDRELQDPVFVRRTAPGPDAMSVEDAFYSIHHRDLMKRQAEEIALRARADAAAGFRANRARPRENGSSATGAVQASPDMRGMTHAQRIAYMKAKYPPAT